MQVFFEILHLEIRRRNDNIYKVDRPVKSRAIFFDDIFLIIFSIINTTQ